MTHFHRKQTNPPKLADHFLKWYCKSHLFESIQGDLHERFEQDSKKYSSLNARFRYWLNVLLFFNRFTLRSNWLKVKFTPMILHHIKPSLRYLAKNKGYLLLNMAGLTAGLLTFLFIGLFVMTEQSFDRFHPGSDRIVRVGTQYAPLNDRETRYVNSPPVLAEALLDNFSEVQAATRMRFSLRILLANGDTRFYEETGFYADSLFFDVLPFHFLAGNPHTALDEVNAIVITEQMALKYFNDPRPLGQLLQLNDEIPLKVTGILDEIPVNSHLQFNYIISFPTYRIPAGYTSTLDSWSWAGFLTYARLQPGADHFALESKINELYQTRLSIRPGFVQTAIVQGLPELYLRSNDMDDDLNSGLKTGHTYIIYALAMVGGLVLIIAAFNFINLTSAMFLNRGKEVSIRKVLGSAKAALVAQLIVESLLIAGVSFALSIMLLIATGEWVMQWFDWSLLVHTSMLVDLGLSALAVTILIGLSAGIYPALSLSSFNPIMVLKGNFKVSTASGSWMRNGLVMAQFCISIGLITATLVVTKQLSYLRTQSTGIQEESVLVVKLLPEHMSLYYPTFKELLQRNSQVLGVSQCERLIGDPWPMNPIRLNDRPDAERKLTAGNLVGENFMDALGIKLIAGRDFDPSLPTDSLNSIIINQQAAHQLGLTEPIGEQVRFFSMNGPRTIIGVVEDFNFSSLHDQITPMVLVKSFIEPEFMLVRVTPGSMVEKVKMIDENWRKIADGVPLEIKFMDDHLNSLYQGEERFSRFIFSFSAIAVVLSCLGLYGLIAFTVRNRLREVSIRKVLGASIPSVFWMLSKQYVRLVLIAAVVIFPLVAYYLHHWLNTFAYRIEMTPWIFASALLLLLMVTCVTITHQIAQVARVNPAHSMRGE